MDTAKTLPNDDEIMVNRVQQKGAQNAFHQHVVVSLTQTRLSDNHMARTGMLH